ncbi:hypothetical protein HPB48_012867 [Haemaphysalis longicornis]|uniref:Globin domain-containing protein n=1 Tax=Haemaphysalis longicornis TaxID=44386 RepID=A0A9J6GC63_HAELO|nr:hypothetical protein HPB48_012867 [Haemaphysalis longicornis]
MGLSLRKKEVPDPTTGLTASDTKLVRETWRSLCSLDSDYGVLVFQALFIRHPEFLPMFSRFKDKDVDSLPDDVHFRAHACAVGNQLTSMVGSADDARLLDALIQKNAMAHTKRRGVAPPHFRELGSCVIEVLALKFEKMMTPQAVAAWEKLFAFMVNVTRRVYEEAQAAAPGPRSTGGGYPEDDSSEPSRGARQSIRCSPQRRFRLSTLPPHRDRLPVEATPTPGSSPQKTCLSPATASGKASASPSPKPRRAVKAESPLQKSATSP